MSAVSDMLDSARLRRRRRQVKYTGLISAACLAAIVAPFIWMDMHADRMTPAILLLFVPVVAWLPFALYLVYKNPECENRGGRP